MADVLYVVTYPKTGGANVFHDRDRVDQELRKHRNASVWEIPAVLLRDGERDSDTREERPAPRPTRTQGPPSK